MSRREAWSWTLPSPAPQYAAPPQAAVRYPAPGAGA